jgi:Rrf2 family transcriptional regulator, nitric oxide-sensitive transcriptional repressor
MQLTQYSDYAFRTLIYLAISGENATITEIAEHYQISRNHLVKVVHNLGKLGYIITTRGRQGGLRLAMPPEQINIGEVVRKTESNFNLVECFDRENNQCIITPACKLMGILGEAFHAFTDVLDQYTLADMASNRDDLRDCLSLPTRLP